MRHFPASYTPVHRQAHHAGTRGGTRDAEMQGRTSAGSTHGLCGAMWVRIMTTFCWEEFKVPQGDEFTRHTHNTRKALKIHFLVLSEGSSTDVNVGVGESA